MPQKVIIASKNPVKINAVKEAFAKMFPSEEFEFDGVSVSSGVSDQPMDNDETLQGALNRANNAKTKFPNADYWVGIEGGIETTENEMSAFAWIVIKATGQMGKAKTSMFFLPNKVVELIKQGKELGETDDIVFGHTNSKQKNGAVGILTGNVVTRTSYYVEAAVLALIPFINPDLYE